MATRIARLVRWVRTPRQSLREVVHGDMKPLIREAAREDIASVALVDREAFGAARAYPDEFLYQQLAINPSLFLVVVVGSEIAGYSLSAVGDDQHGWIMSVAVAARRRRQGLGRLLAQEACDALSRRSATTISLSVDPQNVSAQRLYGSLGFVIVALERDHLGPGTDRILMSRSRGQSADAATGAGRLFDQTFANAQLLMGESQSSIEFTNILFAVSLAMLTIISQSIAETPAIGLLLFVIVTATFYGSVFYAVVAGNIARLARQREVNRAITYGNALSEYLGVLMIIPLMPLLVWVMTTNGALAWIAYGVAMAGYAFYTFSGFDLIRRTFPRSLTRVCIAAAFSTLVGVLLFASMSELGWMVWGSATALVLMQLALTGMHLARAEDSE